jgi:hypothetical protein
MISSFFNFNLFHGVPHAEEQYVNIASPLFVTSFPIVSIARIGTALLLLGVFVQHSGEFTRFLHLSGAALLLYSI